LVDAAPAGACTHNPEEIRIFKDPTGAVIAMWQGTGKM
jgi:hypothetical protein